MQRYFLNDKDKSLNQRLKVYTKFDPNLKALRDALFSNSKESRYLESGLLTLAYLMGVVALNPPHLSDGPDLLIETPKGQIAIIECTTKIADIRKKAGLLIDRKFPLIDSTGPTGSVVDEALAILVVNLPKSQIVDDDDFLAKNGVLLLTKEDIESALTQIEIPPDIDKKFDQAKAAIQQRASILNGQFGQLQSTMGF